MTMKVVYAKGPNGLGFQLARDVPEAEAVR